jgi:transcriptional regulator
MKTLFLQIIKESGEKITNKIREISDEKYKMIIDSDSDEISKEVLQNDFVISIYKNENINIPENLIFDISYEDNEIYLIDEINSRWMLD